VRVGPARPVFHAAAPVVVSALGPAPPHRPPTGAAKPPRGAPLRPPLALPQHCQLAVFRTSHLTRSPLTGAPCGPFPLGSGFACTASATNYLHRLRHQLPKPSPGGASGLLAKPPLPVVAAVPSSERPAPCSIHVPPAARSLAGRPACAATGLATPAPARPPAPVELAPVARPFPRLLLHRSTGSAGAGTGGACGYCARLAPGPPMPLCGPLPGRGH
jgi:hypothetical protein